MTEEIDIIVNKADMKITYPTASAITKGQSLANVVLTGGSTNFGRFEWEDSTQVPNKTGESYVLRFIPNTSIAANYNITNPTKKMIMIVK